MSYQPNRTYGYKQPVTDPDPDAPDDWPPENDRLTPQPSSSRSIPLSNTAYYQHTQGGPANLVYTPNRPSNHGSSQSSSQNASPGYASATTNSYQSDRGYRNTVNITSRPSTSNYYTSQTSSVPSYPVRNDSLAHYSSTNSEASSSRSYQEPSGYTTQATDWSEWILDVSTGRHYRWRRNARGIIEYDYPRSVAA